MKNKFVILLIVLLSFVSCNKNDSGETSGTATINNERFISQTYYVYGFLFSRGELVATTANPSPDITIDTDGTSVFLRPIIINHLFIRLENIVMKRQPKVHLMILKQ